MHFSIGLVTEYSPKRPVVSVCSLANVISDVYAAYVGSVGVDAVWPREDGMDCVDHGCLSRGSICAPRGDDVLVVFSVFDTDGDEFDLTGASEIVFVVSDEKYGQVRIVKRLSTGGIQISTNGFQFSVEVTDDETSTLVRRHNYYEVQVTTSDGLKKTVSAGLFLSEDTIIKDLT